MVGPWGPVEGFEDHALCHCPGARLHLHFLSPVPSPAALDRWFYSVRLCSRSTHEMQGEQRRDFAFVAEPWAELRATRSQPEGQDACNLLPECDPSWAQ